MLFQYTNYPTGHNFQKKIKKIIIDYFKGLLVTHNLDIFMSGIKRDILVFDMKLLLLLFSF